MKYIVAPPDYDEPDNTEPFDPKALRVALLAIVLFWVTVGLLFFGMRAEAATQVYLEGEDDLGNGFKLCHYSEGVTITVAATKLCPLSIKIPD